MRSFWYVCAALACTVCFLQQAVPSDDAEETARFHYQLGQTYYEHGLFSKAEKEFKKVLELLGEKSATASLDGQAAVPQARRDGYCIGEGDSLLVTVWENPDLTQTVTVQPDGNISFPLIDQCQAKGMSLTQLDEYITERLKEYVRFPDVSVSLQKMGGSKVIILGEVQFPDVYELSGSRTVLEAIALAGGFTPDAVASSVVIVKGGPQNPKGMRVNLNKAIHSPASNQNVVLDSEDVVFVPKKFIADVNYFISQFMEPVSTSADTIKAIRGWNK